MRDTGLLSFRDLREYFTCWWYVYFAWRVPLLLAELVLSRQFEKTYRALILVETWMDLQAFRVKTLAWLRGLYMIGGFEGAHKAAAGLA